MRSRLFRLWVSDRLLSFSQRDRDSGQAGACQWGVFCERGVQAWRAGHVVSHRQLTGIERPQLAVLAARARISPSPGREPAGSLAHGKYRGGDAKPIRCTLARAGRSRGAYVLPFTLEIRPMQQCERRPPPRSHPGKTSCLSGPGARPAGVNGGRTATPGPSDMAPRFRLAQYAVASSSQDQAKRHRVWLNCSPLAKPRMVVGVTR